MGGGVDSDDRGKKPDDGWKVSMDNDQPSGKAKIFAIAVCGKVKPAYNDARFTLEGSAFAYFLVGCLPAPAVIGGGQKVGGRWNETTVQRQSWVADPASCPAYRRAALPRGPMAPRARPA